MKNNVTRLIAYMLVVVFSTAILMGCSSVPELDLTTEESELIAEYSAGLLTKYARGHATGLMRVYDDEKVQWDEALNPTPVPEEPVEEDGYGEGTVEEEALVEEVSGEEEGIVSEPVEIAMIPMNEALGLYGASLNYSHYELCDTYPEDGEDLVFAMNATDGHDLLILHFDLYNPTDQYLSCTTALGNYKMRAVINDSDKLRAQLTFLTNDLTNYSNTLEPGTGSDVVLVFEVSKGMEINQLNLLLVDGQEKLEYRLQ